MSVTKRTRFEVLRRDNHTCRYCRATDAPLTVDHVTPVALGGSDSPDNLVAACRDCNAGKSSASPDASLVSDVAQDAVRWAAAMKASAAIRSGERRKRSRYVDKLDVAWRAWGYGPEHNDLPRPGDWEATVWRFYETGLPIEELLEAVQIACGNRKVVYDETWRYMCGVAWSKLTALQTLAREQLEWTDRT